MNDQERTPDATAAFQRARARAWLRDFAHQSGMSYDELLACVAECREYGHYTFGDDAPADMFRSNADLFWRYYELALDEDVPEKDHLTFSCAC